MPASRGDPVAKRVHVAELPGRVDMEQREGRRRREEGLAGEVEHHRAVLADRIEHHRPLGLGDDLAHDVDALRLELLEMGEAAAAEGGGRVHDAPPPAGTGRRRRRGASRATRPMTTVTGAPGRQRRGEARRWSAMRAGDLRLRRAGSRRRWRPPACRRDRGRAAIAERANSAERRARHVDDGGRGRVGDRRSSRYRPAACRRRRGR